MAMKHDFKHSNETPSKSSAGGIFIALGVTAGVLIGGMLGQPSIGLLAGFALGALIALAIWLRER